MNPQRKAATAKARNLRRFNLALNNVHRRIAAREVFGPRILAAREQRPADGHATPAEPPAADTPPTGAVYIAPRQRRTSPPTTGPLAFIPGQSTRTARHHRGDGSTGHADR